MRILLINGPPRSGKDTLGAAIVRQTEYCAAVVKFATVLKRMTHALYGVDQPPEWFDRVKDMPNPLFLGASPRQAYIAVSEQLMKPLHGPDVFGRLLLRQLENLDDDGVPLAVVTDSGFREEAEVLVRAFGRDNVYLVRLARPGTDFSNDSRGYIDLDLPAGHELHLRNDGPVESVEALAAMALEMVR